MKQNEETIKADFVPFWDNISFSYTASCLICGDSVEVCDVPVFSMPCVCDKCKKAVMEMRKNMEKEKE